MGRTGTSTLQPVAVVKDARAASLQDDLLQEEERRRVVAITVRRFRIGPEATGSQPSCDAVVWGRVVPCTQGDRWGTGVRGEQCRRAPGPSRHSMCRRPAPPLWGSPAGCAAAAPRVPPSVRSRSIGLVLGIGLVAAVALGPRPVQRRVLVAGGRSVDAGPPRHHGTRPVQLYGVAPALGDRRVGVRRLRSPRCFRRVREPGLQPLRHCARRALPHWRWRRTPGPSAQAAAGSPPSSSCSPSASPVSWPATAGSTSPWCGSRSSFCS